MRSAVVRLLERLDYPAELEELRRSPELTWIHPNRTVALEREGVIFGYVGALHPDVCGRLEVPLTTTVA